MFQIKLTIAAQDISWATDHIRQYHLQLHLKLKNIHLKNHAKNLKEKGTCEISYKGKQRVVNVNFAYMLVYDIFLQYRVTRLGYVL